MINVRDLKLKRIFNLKEYLEEKAKRDKEYTVYVETSIKKGLEDIEKGRIESLDKVLWEIEEEFGLEKGHYIHLVDIISKRSKKYNELH